MFRIYFRHLSYHVEQVLLFSNNNKNRNSFIFLFILCFYLPGGFDTFNDDGRFICGRPTFSVVVVVNIVDVDGLLLEDSS